MSLDEDIVKYFVDSVSYVRSVDGFLVKLGSTIYAIEDRCREPSCDTRGAVKAFLDNRAVEQRLARLKCHWDMARDLITSDPRHAVLRKYLDLLDEKMSSLECVSPGSLVSETPDALWRKEALEKEAPRTVAVPRRDYERLYRRLVVVVAAAALALIAIYLLARLLPSITGLLYGASPSTDSLRVYVLGLINHERTIRGLPPLKLFPDQGVAQRHAEEMSRYNYISHWDRAGRLPHIRWAMAGYTGIGVSESVGLVEYRGGRPSESFLRSQLAAIIHEMIYNDAAHNWGHRDDLLDPAHNYVAIGVAYDEDSVALVIDSLNVYINWSIEPSLRGDRIVFEGVIPARFADPREDIPVEILVLKTEPPHPLSDPEKQRPQSWSLGEPVAGILPIGFSGKLLYIGYQTLYENVSYRALSRGVEVSADIRAMDIALFLGDGVYVVAVVAEDHVYRHPYRENNTVILSNLVIVVNGLEVSTISGDTG